jgi:S1-C subfamily serine protease
LVTAGCGPRRAGEEKEEKMRFLKAGVATLIALFASCALAQTTPKSATPRDAEQAAQWASFKIEDRARATNATVWTGTGFWIEGQPFALTNNHVATDAAINAETRKIVAIDASGRERAVKVVWVDLERDLAALEVEGAPMWRLPINAEGPRIGDPIMVGGYGLGMPFALVGGRYAQTYDQGKDARMVLSAATDGGVSGGPTIDAKGRVVGVNVAKAGRSLGLSIPASEAIAFLGEAKRRQEQGRQLWRLGRTQIAEIYKQQLEEANERKMALFFGEGGASSPRPGWQTPQPAALASLACSDASGLFNAPDAGWVIGTQCHQNTAGWSVGGDEGGAGWTLTSNEDRPAKESAEWRSRFNDASANDGCQTNQFILNGQAGTAVVCVEPDRLRSLDGLYNARVEKILWSPQGRDALSVTADGLSENGVRRLIARVQAVGWRSAAQAVALNDKKGE